MCKICTPSSLSLTFSYNLSILATESSFTLCPKRFPFSFHKWYYNLHTFTESKHILNVKETFGVTVTSSQLHKHYIPSKTFCLKPQTLYQQVHAYKNEYIYELYQTKNLPRQIMFQAQRMNGYNHWNQPRISWIMQNTHLHCEKGRF